MKKKNVKKKKLLCPEIDVLDQLTEPQTRALLKDLVYKLDDLSLADFFGTEGWRKYLGYGE